MPVFQLPPPAQPSRPFSISPPPGRKSLAAWLACAPKIGRKRSLAERLFRNLSPNALAAAPYLFELWGRIDHQLPPEGDWSIWAILGGRGAGKTRSGAEWVRAQVEGAGPQDPGRCRRVALVAETLDQAREVMVMGESGLLAVSPPDRRPKYLAARRMLQWPNGATAQLFSASDPDSMRGPQFDAAWSDEIAKWRNLDAAWDMLQFALRLGPRPRQVLTTTPRPAPGLLRILELPECVFSTAPTAANAANLAPSFVQELTARYAGAALGRQELDGAFLLESPGALWTREMLERSRCAPGPCDEANFTRVVVAVDPPASAHDRSDACGIIVAGLTAAGEGVVLQDASAQGLRPLEWAARAIGAYHAWGADRLIAEVNQGGAMVEAVLRQVDPNIAFKSVYARHGKAARAEPVAALYEQGRIGHAGRFDALEDELCALAPGGGANPSPDRADALVWALTELLLSNAAAPRIRGL